MNGMSFPNSNRAPKRNWQRWLVIRPRRLMIEGVGRRWVFLRTICLRWSYSQERWLYKYQEGHKK